MKKHQEKYFKREKLCQLRNLNKDKIQKQLRKEERLKKNQYRLEKKCLKVRDKQKKKNKYKKNKNLQNKN